MKILIVTILGSILSGILYRAGGMDKAPATKPTWIPMWLRNTKTRDWGCPLVVIGMMYAFGLSVTPWWLHSIASLLMQAALTTYWDKIFGFDNFYMHGFVIGIACIPYLFAGFGGAFWMWWLLRSTVMGVFMGAWCASFEDDVTEEVGRGAIIAATVPLFLI